MAWRDEQVVRIDYSLPLAFLSMRTFVIHVLLVTSAVLEGPIGRAKRRSVYRSDLNSPDVGFRYVTETDISRVISRMFSIT